MNFLDSYSIVILLGAGASREADIPTSAQMIAKIEEHVSGSSSEWSRYKDLYNSIRSAVIYSEGIHGNYDAVVSYNIERLVDTLSEIGKHNRHILYPFVGSWNPTLVEVAGPKFKLADEFRTKIIDELRRDWLAVDNYTAAAQYYNGLFSLQREYQYPLRVFTLNYDLCVERSAENESGIVLTRGFDDQRIWDWSQFIESQSRNPDIYLYKLHGSMDWRYDENDVLTYSDDASRISVPAFIFGTSYKLEYRDPFLFLMSEFRRCTLLSSLILVIGYGFGDEHINVIIRQALRGRGGRKLLVVEPVGDENVQQRQRQIAKSLDLSNYEQIQVYSQTASEFMKKNLNRNELGRHLIPQQDLTIPF